MFQKINKLELLKLLQTESKHLRKLSVESNIPSSTVMRVLDNLIKENILDFRIEGKNKIFFIKDSFEGNISKIELEYYKLREILQNSILQRIYKEIKPLLIDELVILFGSYAKKLESKESDIDIYIEKNNKELKKKIELISSKISIKSGFFDKNSFLGKEIIKNHIILNNPEKYYAIIK